MVKLSFISQFDFDNNKLITACMKETGFCMYSVSSVPAAGAASIGGSWVKARSRSWVCALKLERAAALLAFCSVPTHQQLQCTCAT